MEMTKKNEEEEEGTDLKKSLKIKLFKIKINIFLIKYLLNKIFLYFRPTCFKIIMIIYFKIIFF